MQEKKSEEAVATSDREIEATPEASPQEAPKRRRRTLTKSDGPMVKSMGTLEVQTITVDGRTYCQRYVRCGRGCARCDTASPQFDAERPGHGPYWYRIVKGKDGQTVRRYLGKRLPVEGGA